MRVGKGQKREAYLDNEARQKYANEPHRVRRKHPGDKLRRKAFEKKL